FFEFKGDKISCLDEYWGDDGIAPQWRLDKQIGQPIR
ncbi:MAG: nuclear transport factor 2 family protein, partial [Clostridiaceae bacterium]|nr:nuclear transport factor 2 family protein [Clostridiaceae bacterium]